MLTRSARALDFITDHAIQLFQCFRSMVVEQDYCFDPDSGTFLKFHFSNLLRIFVPPSKLYTGS
jgi:hypothetical protein